MDVQRSAFDVCCINSASDDPASFRRSLLVWFQQNGRDLPWRRTHDPYAILISEVMLQQTQVATVLPYYSEWLRRFPDFKSLAAAPESDVLHAWQGLGYYARARNLHAAAKAVMESHGGLFPVSVEEIRKLPGLGRYTANAVATFAFDQSVPIVEANTARCLARLLNLQIRVDSSEGQRKLWDLATALLPKRSTAVHNSALMDLGALVCISGQPKCPVCPVRAFCRAVDPAQLPLKKARTPTKQLTEFHGLARRNGHVLLEQSLVRWRGMWILPRLRSSPPGAALLHSSEFPFTHHRVRLEVYAAPFPNESATEARQWFSHEQIHSLPMPSPHRRALTALLCN